MKTLKQISLLCLFWMIGMSVSAYDFTATNADGVTIYYNITSSTSPKTVAVTKDFDSWFQSYYAQTINIPNTVTYNGNTYGVTGIGGEAFYNATTVKSITLPKYLTSIGNSAFYACENATIILTSKNAPTVLSGGFLYVKTVYYPKCYD